MRTWIIAASLTVVLALCATLAPGQSASPTRVREIGLYNCPDHPEIQATWPAQCPRCGTTLQTVQLFNTAVSTVQGIDTDEDQDQGFSPQPQWLHQPYGPPGYYPYPEPAQYNSQEYPPTTQYGNQGSYPPSGQYGSQRYPPTNQYGTQGYNPQNYPYGSQGYPPSNQYGYPPSSQYGYPPSNQYGYPPSGQYGGQGYPPYNQYGSQGYPPYPPSSQYGQGGYPPYPPSNQYGQGYPPYNPNYGYGQGGYPNPPYGQTEPNSPYGGILEDLNRLFNRRSQQSPQ
jgi:hypothetical protein